MADQEFIREWVYNNLEVGMIARWRERWANMDSVCKRDMLTTWVICVAIGIAIGVWLPKLVEDVSIPHR